MRLMPPFILLLLLMLSTSCVVNYEVVTKMDREIDFDMYKSFRIVQTDHGLGEGTNPMIKVRVRRAISSELERMGYIPSTQPDFEIYWFVDSGTKLEQGLYNPYNRNWNTSNSIHVVEYKEVTFNIDIVDAQNETTVWQGCANGKLDEEHVLSDSNIKKVVKELFNNYQKDTGISKVNAYAIE